MRTQALVVTLLLVLLAGTAVAIVTSRHKMLDAHRLLLKSDATYQKLLDEERTLKVELVSRTDLNSVEQRARQELGMVPPRPDQWRIIMP